MRAPPKPLPSRPENEDYDQAIRAALEGLSLAIAARLRDRDDPWRFQDVTRLSKIGQATARQLARQTGQVDDFRRRRRGVPCYGAPQGNLGGVDAHDDDPFVEPMDPLYAGINPFPPVGPYGGGVDAGNPFGAAQGILGSLTDSKEKELEANRRLDVLKELKHVRELLQDEAIDEGERTVLEGRREKLLDEIGGLNEADDVKAKLRERQKAPPETRRLVRCLDARCGVAHDEGWVTEDGQPRGCDVCGGPMGFEVEVGEPAHAHALGDDPPQELRRGYPRRGYPQGFLGPG